MEDDVVIPLSSFCKDIYISLLQKISDKIMHIVEKLIDVLEYTY